MSLKQMRPQGLSFGLCTVASPHYNKERERNSAFSSLSWADKRPYTMSETWREQWRLPSHTCQKSAQAVAETPCQDGESKTWWDRVRWAPAERDPRCRETHCRLLWPETCFGIVLSIPSLGKPPPITTLSKAGWCACLRWMVIFRQNRLPSIGHFM